MNRMKEAHRKNRNNRRSLFLLNFFFCFGLLSSDGWAQESREEGPWVFSYFKGNGEDGLHLAYSTDGYHWQTLRNDSSFLRPAVGKDKLMRDPCIIRGADGKFHMVWTVSWKEKGIGYASSTDLIHWSEQKYLPVMEHEPEARNAWAPEISYDAGKKEYLIYWATTVPGRFPQTDTMGDNNHRIYAVRTKDFSTFSRAELFYEKGFNVIDASIQPVSKKKYVMFLKDETRRPAQKNIRVAFSKKGLKKFGPPSAPITGRYWAEGPTVLRMKDRWIVYFDKYTEHKYGAVSSPDLVHWTDISDQVALPNGLRHGTIVRLSDTEMEALLKYSGNPH